MDRIVLTPMTKVLARQYYREFTLDPDLFLDKRMYKPFVYSEEFSDNRVDRYKALGRIFLAVMLDDKPIGEIVLKEIDYAKRCCTIGISMINDNYKNKGYGTAAEQLALEYALGTLALDTVFADTLITNHRSQLGIRLLSITGAMRQRTPEVPRSEYIIAYSHSERNKIFILLRSF